MTKTSVAAPSILFALALSLLFISTLAATAAGDKAREEAVLKFEHEWSDSWLKGDVNAMKGILTDDFVEVAAEGEVLSRAEHLEQFRRGNSNSSR
jgi:hypothetical protein